MRKHFSHALILLLMISFGAGSSSFAQTDTVSVPKPVIKGDSLLCPNSTGTLTTQKGYDSYQWYKRNYGSNKKTAIEGATANQLNVSSNETPAYFSVVTTVKNFTLKSDEKLVDGLVFILPSVKISGDFKNGPGYSILKEGDTGIFTLTKPYNSNITWYKNSEPIVGETSAKLYVTTGGVYTVQGAPRACPDYIVPLGVDLYVKLKKPVTDSASGYTVQSNSADASTASQQNALKIYPNPAKDIVRIEGLAATGKTIISVVDMKGNTVVKTSAVSSSCTLNIQKLSPGIYHIKMENGGLIKIIKLMKD